MKFKGRTALVSGAGGPMGGAIAMRLAAEGANLVLTDISARRLDGIVAQVALQHPQARVVAERASVLVQDEVDALLAMAAGHFEAIDVLVNVVGGIRGALAVPVLEMDDERWDSTMELNLKGIFRLVRRVGAGMRARGYGRIVNISSVTFAGDVYQPEYGAAKAAVASITRSLALELAPDITVNCIAPGLIATSVLERVDPQLVQYYHDRTPLKRLGKPEDIAAAVAFLASDDAAFITGAILPVSGGIWPAL
jgi:NAD(P)-dependent dehydrogenase (short-subunit alcohol dehydrogenase family)